MGRPKKSIEDAIYNVTKHLDSIVKQTAKDTARKLKEDMKKQAKIAVKHYYDSYIPDLYIRTHALYHSYKIKNETKDNKVSVYIEFDPLLIQGEHQSHSQYHQSGDVWQSIKWPKEVPTGNNYGVPEADWILNNFWEGIHPIVTGSKYTGFNWSPKQDKKSPQDLFDEFVNGGYIENILIPYANDILTNRVIKAINKQFK